MSTDKLIRAARFITVLAALLLLSSCSTVSYYSQSVVGHSRLMLARKDVDKVIEQADDNLKAQLLLSKELRAFSVAELSLPKSQSYTTYVALKREYPVWTVVATPEFSLQAQQWCYPVIGCASYRGYFSKKAANIYAQKLQDKGLETDVGGASAYSTLGWFADPLLPSMMRYGDSDFAETLFHEIAHQKLYINGDSDFNEAFASLVGEVGVRRWLTKHSPEKLIAYENSLLVREQFFTLITETKHDLLTLYESGKSRRMILSGKQQIFSELKQRYEALIQDKWNGRAWFKSWFDKPINNAKFASLATYRDRVPELRTLLASCSHSLPRFYRTLSDPQKKDGKVVIPKVCLEFDEKT